MSSNAPPGSQWPPQGASGPPASSLEPFVPPLIPASPVPAIDQSLWQISIYGATFSAWADSKVLVRDGVGPVLCVSCAMHAMW